MIEFDVRVTKDDIPVVHHNEAVLDPSGDKFVIDRFTYHELKEHSPGLLRFKDLLKHVNGAVSLYVEVKPGVNTAPIVDTLKGYKHSCLLGSFSQDTLVELQVALPKIPKVVIDNWSGVRARLRAKKIGTKTIAMNQMWLWPGFIRAMKHAGYELYAYTINNPAKARRWAKHGLAGVVTDYPDRFKS